MAEYQPNPQQDEFLKAGNCNVLVSASAGSGKTSTMIQKLIKILYEEKTPITSLLVVTYTNAAASEIKLKLFNELTKLISTTQDKSTREFLKVQLDGINNAEIGTLHAICRKLIVKFFYELGESPDFGLLSDKEEKYLIDMAVNNVFTEHMSKDDNEFFELYDCYNSNRSDMKLKKIALQLYNFKVSKTDYVQWKNGFLEDSYNTNTSLNTACNYLLEYYQKRIVSFSTQILKLKNIANENNFEKYFTYLDSRYQFVNEFSVVSDFDTAVKVIGNLSLSNKPKCTEKTSVDEQLFDEQVSLFGKSFKLLIDEIKDNFTSSNPDEIKDNIDISKNNVIKLLNIVDEIEEKYSNIKKKKNVLDFNDLEDKMLKLLDNSKIKESLKLQYKYIFVDEYQDINDKQEKILLNLVSGDNYYMIGDVKQSIYAFRQSSPKIFLSKYNEFAKEDNNDRVINFNINYRSDRNILEFANSVFDHIITNQTIGIDYAKDARFESKKNFCGCNVSLGILSTGETEEDSDYLEAKLIAEQISSIVGNPKLDGSFYKFGDIAIILRQRGTFVSTLYDILSSYQIPVKASINSDFFGTSEVCLMVAILKVLSNHKDDVAIATLLKNLFDVCEDELMAIRNSFVDLSFSDAVFAYEQDDEIKNKIERCKVFIESSRRKLTTLTIKEFLNDVVKDFGLMIKLKATPCGQEKVNNVSEFIRISDNANYQYNIDAFLDYLDIISKDNTPKIVGAGNNAVEICTIHHSKGLEYPVVILGRLGKKFQLNKDSGDIIMNSKFGVGLKSIDSKNRVLNETIIRTASKLDNKKSEIDEEIRLLYVAMTRAKEKLIMLGEYDIEKIAINKRKDVYNTITPFDMIFKSVKDVYLPSFETKKEFFINEEGQNIANVRIYAPSDLIEEDVGGDNPVILNSPNEQLLNLIHDTLNKKIDLKTTTIKNSVTNILREESDYENLNFLPSKLDPSDKVPATDALKLGTAYHTVMQEIKFTENYLELEELIDHLVKEGKLEKELVGLIKIEEILKCISVLKDLISEAKQVYREKQFLLCENYNKLVDFTDNNTKVIVQGVIDLVVITNDGVFLIDYKTNRGVSAEELARTYSLQLKLYSHAFEEASGIKVSQKYLYSFKLGNLIKVD